MSNTTEKNSELEILDKMMIERDSFVSKNLKTLQTVLSCVRFVHIQEKYLVSHSFLLVSTNTTNKRANLSLYFYASSRL